MFDRNALAKKFNDLGFKTGAEIGVATGRFSEILCQSIPGLKLTCVDPWDKIEGNNRGGSREKQQRNFNLAIEKLGKYGVTILRMTSMEALRLVPAGSLDFVFLDANHDYLYVKQDVEKWSKKVRVGGIVSGHDYYNFKKSGVIEAVDEYVKANGIELHLTDKNPRSRDDKEPSFYWFKK